MSEVEEEGGSDVGRIDWPRFILMIVNGLVLLALLLLVMLAPLPLGANKFSLVVVDDAGNVSAPTILEVIVRDLDKPTAVLDVVDATLKRIEPVVPFGSPFTLSGARSSDVAPGKVVEYRFMLVDPKAPAEF